MEKQTYSLPAEATLVLASCGGQISLVGGDRDEVVLKGPRTPQVHQSEGQFEIESLHGAHKILLPRGSAVTVREASGELAIRKLAGNVVVEAAHGKVSLRDLEGVTAVRQANGQVEARRLASLRLSEGHGDVHLRRIGDLDIQEAEGDVFLSRVSQSARIVQVNGDLMVDNIDGPLSIDEVAGDLRVRRVAGQLFVNQVTGDLTASRLSGGASVEEVGGDVKVSIDPAPGQEYRFRAYGDILLRVPTTACLHLTVETPSGSIRHDLPLTVEEEDEHRLVGVMSPSAKDADAPPPEPAVVTLVSAGGSVRLRADLDWDQEMSRWGEQFGQEMGRWGEQFGQEMAQWGEQFGQEMSRWGEEIGHGVAGAFGSVDAERFGDQVTEAAAKAQVRLEHRLKEIDVEDLARKAEAAATAGIARAQEAVRRAMSRLEQEEHASPNTAPVTPPPDKAASQEEKLAILKMIETGTITAAEGEMLLDALED